MPVKPQMPDNLDSLQIAKADSLYDNTKFKVDSLNNDTRSYWDDEAAWRSKAKENSEKANGLISSLRETFKNLFRISL
jgi:hypothetical protein